jgi:hypothetical protein
MDSSSHSGKVIQKKTVGWTTNRSTLIGQSRQALEKGAPAYLRPAAQRKLLATAADCLEVIELAVNWEAEKLYDVEGLGPFDEF